MKGKVNKTWLTVLAVLLAVTLVSAACSSGNNAERPSATPETSETAEPAQSEQPVPTPKEDPLTVNVLLMHTYPDSPAKDNDMHQWVLENHNLDLQIRTVTENQTDRMNQMLAGGDIPDVVVVLSSQINNEIANKWADAGLIMDMEPWIAKYPDLLKWNDPNYNKSVYANKNDGKMYVIPANPASIKEVIKPVIGSIIREDWLQQVGMKAPETPDELAAVLKAFKEQIPDVDGKPIIPATFDNLRQLFMYSWTKNWHSLENNYQTLYWWFNHPQIVEYMVFMNRLYQEGLLDPEFIVQQPDQYQAKLSAGRVGFTLNTHVPMDIANSVLKEQGANARYIPSPPIQVPGLPLPIYSEASPNQFLTVAVSSRFGQNERNVERVMEFLNWNMSNDGAFILSHGPEGEFYVPNSEGLFEPKPEIKAELDKGDQSFQVKTGLGYYNLLNAPVIPARSVLPGTEEAKMGHTIWAPAIGAQDVPFAFSGFGEAWNTHWNNLWPEIARWEAKAIFAETEEEARKITQDMIAHYKTIGEPEVTAEKLELIQKWIKDNNYQP